MGLIAGIRRGANRCRGHRGDPFLAEAVAVPGAIQTPFSLFGAGRRRDRTNRFGL
jgi:hypothetical protein